MSSNVRGCLKSWRTAARIRIRSMTAWSMFGWSMDWRFFAALTRSLGRHSAQKKINRVANAAHQLVRTRRSGHPVSYHRVVERFHELGQMIYGTRARDFFALMFLFQNSLQQA